MFLRKLLEGVPVRESAVGQDVEITSISYDSRTLEKGALFVALSGYHYNGHHFMTEALEKGAAAVICSKRPETAGPWFVVDDSRKALALLSSNWF